MALPTLPDAAAAAAWLRARVPGTLRVDSRRVAPGDGFVAWPGHATDGRRFVPAALAAGAAACLVEAEGAAAFAFDDPRVAALAGLKTATGPLADLWFGRPSQALRVVASTGTNGKTSTAWWTAQALAASGRPCGLVGTLGVGAFAAAGAPPALDDTGLTTPDPVTLHAALRRFADAGCSAAALEASSIGLEEQRLAGVRIEVALFTNFTRDHLDYHGTMDAYWQAKRRLFDWPGLRAAVLNVDDARGAELAQALAARGGDAPELWTVACGRPARLWAAELQQRPDGLQFVLREGDAAWPVRSPLVGGYNASNLLVVAAALRALGVPAGDVVAALHALGPVPGRLQRVGGGDGVPQVVVDYAHTPDALEQVLKALQPLAAARGGRLWCVFGCGGNRDATKRPLMGAIARRLADRVVLTSDNPRDEVPAAILAQILAGAAGVAGGDEEPAVIEDRAAAIAHAVAAAAAADVVLVAGKGHEPYQETAGVRRPFSDAGAAAAALRQREGTR